MDLDRRVQEALDQALAIATRPGAASASVRAALRVAVLRNDVEAQIWLRREIEGMGAGRDRTEDRLLFAKLTALVGEEDARDRVSRGIEKAIARRRLDASEPDSISGHSVSDMETLFESIVKVYEEPVAQGMTPIDTGLAAMRREKERVQIYPQMVKQEMMLRRTQDAAFQYLIDVEAAILAGEATPDVVARGRQFVDTELSRIAPAALEALASAQERLLVGTAEARSQAATSCRRAIKALADSLYPPSAPVTDEHGVERNMDDDHYRNRLIEYVRLQKGRSTHADVLASNLVELGTRLKSLDDLASKGVHSAVSEAQAESCVIWTYMLAADLLRVVDESSK